MKRLLVLTALTAAPLAPLVACEGEPPVNAPENALGTQQEVAPSPPAAEIASEARVPTAPTTACRPPPCAPMSAAPAASAGSPSAVPEPTPPETEPAPPPTVARGNIVGALTTKPASLLGQAVVYLEDGPTEDAPSHLQTVTIENKQMTFIPYISVVAVGGKVVFANIDPFPHNVFSPDNEKFNMGNIPQNGAHVRTFKSPGMYALLCNLHPGMLGYLAVTPSTWFARTDGKGNFTMKQVPTGTYKVTAWAPRQTPVTQSVTVGVADVTIHFDLHR